MVPISISFAQDKKKKDKQADPRSFLSVYLYFQPKIDLNNPYFRLTVNIQLSLGVDK